MYKGRIFLLVCALVFSALPASAGSENPEPLTFDQGDSVASAAVAAAQIMEPNFQVETVFSGLNLPTVVRFSPDGRVFVAEKGGTVKVFDSLTDPTPTTAVDLSTEVYAYWDRGLLGMALHPNFPTTPYIYLLYTLDTHPYNDACPSPPGANTDGCMANGKLVKVQVNPDNTSGSPVALITGMWCQQFPSHSIGTVEFGPEGALYVSGGDGASFTVVDYGQLGGTLSGTPTPQNPCGDPVNEGGALRSQDSRTSGDPLSFHGTVLRINPDTGAAWAGNPLAGGDSSDDAILANGLRNPFRMAVAPDGDVFVGDVGWNTWEEINKIPSGAFRNFGWPCYEGSAPQSGYDAANLPICETIYGSPGTVTAPLFTYRHGVSLQACPEAPGSISAITGLAFYPGGNYPATYDGALFFADYSRACVWVMFPGTGGDPNPANILRFINEEPSVGLYAGPGGDIFSIDHLGGRVRRFTYIGATNNPPIAVASASPQIGPVPLTVTFSSAGSSDPDGDPLTYAWDLDGDGAYDDAFVANPTYTYTTAGSYSTRLQLSDGRGGIATTDPIIIQATAGGNAPPVATIISPASTLTWAVGQTINLEATATDESTNLTYTWTVTIVHCSQTTPDDCHLHVETTFSGPTATYVTPDHDYPSRLRFDLTVTDPAGLSDTESVEIYARSAVLSVATVPAGLQVVIGSAVATSLTVIVNSQQTISAVTPQTLRRTTYVFRTWQDGNTNATRIVTVPSNVTYTATFNAVPTAKLTASPKSGGPGATINYTATATDADGTYTIAWDTDNDGQFDDGSGTTRSITYPTAGTYVVKIQVTDNWGATVVATSTVTIRPPRGG